MAVQTLSSRLRTAGALIILAGSLGFATVAAAVEVTMCDGSAIPGLSSDSTDSKTAKKDGGLVAPPSQKEAHKEAKASTLDRLPSATEAKASTSR